MRTIKITFFLSCFLLLSGCWDYIDINHRVLPVVMGFSQESERFTVTLLIPIPGQDQQEIKVVSRSGSTITEAIENIRTDMESQVDLLHLRLLVVEKAMTTEGIDDLIEYTIRTREISPRSLIAVSDEKIEKLFNGMKQVTKDATSFYDFFERNGGWNPNIPATHLWEMFQGANSHTKDFPLPVVKSDKEAILDYTGSIVMRNAKMVGEITPDETLLLNVYRGEDVGGKIEIMERSSVMVMKSKLRQKESLNKGTPSVKSVLTLDVTVLETKGIVSNEDIIQELTMQMESRFYSLIERLQKEKSDVLGFGQLFRNHIPFDQLKKWRSTYYPNLDVNFNVKVNIRNNGNLKPST